jgi:signal transduction histidine kinase
MKSITGKLMSSVTLLILLFISLIYGANLFFLDDYFLLKTKASFEKEYYELMEAYGSGSIDFLALIRTRTGETGMKFTVSDSDRNILYISTPEFRTGNRYRLPREKAESIGRIGDTYFYGIIERDQSGKKEILLSGFISRDAILFITLPLEHLKTNVSISNQFILIIGSLVFIFFLIVTWLFSRSTVKPVKELIDLSGRIAMLDFSRPYSGNRGDEIDELGLSLNSTALQLEQTIENLKNEMTLQKRFLASVSHELKSPIGLIRGYSEALNMICTEEDGDIKNYSGIILSESDRMTGLINDLLLLLKMNSTSFVLEKSEFDLVKTVKSVIKKYDIKMKMISDRIDLVCPVSLPVFADESRLVQAIENILNNALMYGEEHSTISVEISAQSGMVSIRITNLGHNIPEDQLPHLFDPFYSADMAGSRDGTGTGLGLSIVKSIIDNHNGNCMIENTDKGVSVLMRIPDEM